MAVRVARGALKFGSKIAAHVATYGALALMLLGAASPTNDPYEIYDRARDVWRKQMYPSDIQYRTTVHVTEGDKDEQEHYIGEASVADGIRVDGVSDEEAATPHKVTGINFKVHLEISAGIRMPVETSAL